MLCRANRLVADAFCIGLWQSAQPRLLFACARSWPVQSIATLVAGQALGILHVHRRSPTPGEPDERGLVERVPGVIRARAVAGFAPLPLNFALRIQPEDLRMKRLAEMLVLLAVAFDTPRLADVLGRLHGRASRQAVPPTARPAARRPSRPWPGPSTPPTSRWPSRSFATPWTYARSSACAPFALSFLRPPVRIPASPFVISGLTHRQDPAVDTNGRRTSSRHASVVLRTRNPPEQIDERDCLEESAVLSAHTVRTPDTSSTSSLTIFWVRLSRSERDAPAEDSQGVRRSVDADDQNCAAEVKSRGVAAGG